VFRDPIRIVLVIASVVLCWPALADNAALFINNSNYSQLDNPRSTRNDDRIIQALRSSDFLVTSGQSKWGEEMQTMVQLFSGQLADAERSIVVLGGHFVHTKRGSWLLGTETKEVDDVSVGMTSLSVGAVLDRVAGQPGRAVVLLAPSDNPPEGGAGLQPGIGPLDIPQGVTVIIGTPDLLGRLMVRSLLQPGTTLADVAAAADPDIRVTGFVTDAMSFLPEDSIADPTVDAEEVFWQASQAIGTVEALEAYLNRYPQGRFRDAANGQIVELRDAPQRNAEAQEQALGLNRDARKQIQRDLALLGYDPRGIDGIFGRGTRAAVTRWQKQNGFDETGFLSGNQIAKLQSEAEVRAAELEEEARLRQLEEERRDREFWQGTGISGDEDDLRAYLERYPDGVYSELARDQLAVFEAERRATAEAEEREYWDDVREADSADLYRSYLQRYPDGVFSEDARARLRELEGVNDTRSAADRQEERRVAGNLVTRLLVEQRLHFLGLNPGSIDGRFNEATRRAIRRFQRARDLTPTGYVTEQTMVHMLSR